MINTRQKRRNLPKAVQLVTRDQQVGTIDFEVALRDALTKSSENNHIQLCFFHFGHTLWHVQTTGKASDHTNNLEFREHVRMVPCTAFLPVDDVVPGFEKLQNLAQTIVSHYSATLKIISFGRFTLNGKRQKPRFAIEQWNWHEETKNNLPRTNNAVEGCNSNFANLINAKHPSKSKLIDKFKYEQKK